MIFQDLQKVTMQHCDEYIFAIERVVKSGWFLLGEETSRFERDFSRYIFGTVADDSHKGECIAVANGLDALWLILRAYKEQGLMRDGDEIIVPANTYIATILAITRNNLTPVLVEPTWDNLELDVDIVEEAITPRTKGVMTVHLYGRLSYSPKLREICNRYGLKLIEDCAQSHGCGCWVEDEQTGIKMYRKTGALGDAAAFSFYPGKNLGAFGDAGAVVTADHELAAVVRALANYGSEKKYVFGYEGINSRMSEIDAAVLDVKLKYLDEDNRRRQTIASYYYDNIDNPFVTLPRRLDDEANVYHLFPIFSERRDELQAYLNCEGIGTLIHYPIPPHHQACYSDASWNNPRLSLPITERIHRQELSLPMNPAVTDSEAAMVVEAVNRFR